jgi:hypothetical protein
VWIVPTARMKGVLERKAHSDAHTTPLSAQAVAVLKDLHPQTGYGMKGRSISENEAQQALRSKGYLDHVPYGCLIAVSI